MRPYAKGQFDNARASIVKTCAVPPPTAEVLVLIQLVSHYVQHPCRHPRKIADTTRRPVSDHCLGRLFISKLP